MITNLQFETLANKFICPDQRVFVFEQGRVKIQRWVSYERHWRDWTLQIGVLFLSDFRYRFEGTRMNAVYSLGHIELVYKFEDFFLHKDIFDNTIEKASSRMRTRNEAEVTSNRSITKNQRCLIFVCFKMVPEFQRKKEAEMLSTRFGWWRSTSFPNRHNEQLKRQCEISILLSLLQLRRGWNEKSR